MKVIMSFAGDCINQMSNCFTLDFINVLYVFNIRV